jgi:hypothetical protein
MRKRFIRRDVRTQVSITIATARNSEGKLDGSAVWNGPEDMEAQDMNKQITITWLGV